MWKLVSARQDVDHLFSIGDLIRTRQGSSTVAEYTLVRHPSNERLVWKEEGGKELYAGWSSNAMTRGSMSQMGDFYGKAIDLWIPDAKPTKSTSVGKMLVHKDHCVLQDGRTFLLEPHEGSKDRNTYKVKVSVHQQGSARPQGIMQVHILLVQSTGDTVTFKTQTLNPGNQGCVFSNIGVVDFTKHFCYLIEEGVKLCPNGTKAIPEREEEPGVFVTDTDTQGQYIVWCPTSDLPPRNINKGQKQAKAIAASMSERYGKTFYWARLMGKVEQAVKVVKTTETKISTL